MFIRLIKKMISNKWMIFCLLVGVIIATTMISSIPIYTNGILQRMLIKDLQTYQINNKISPTTYDVVFQRVNYDKDKTIDMYNDNVRKIESYAQDLNLPIINSYKKVSNSLLLGIDEEKLNTGSKDFHTQIQAYSDIENHTKLLYGKLPSNKEEAGIYEVIASPYAVKNLNLNLNKIYIIRNVIGTNEKYIKIKLVGIYESNDSLYWGEYNWEKDTNFIMDYSLFCSDYLKNDFSELTDISYHYVFDYKGINLKNVDSILLKAEKQYKEINEFADFSFPLIDIFNSYNQRSGILKLTLLVLEIPIMLMLIFYLFMVSQLIIDGEKNEIAVLKSRGSSRLQIFRSYFTQSFLLGIMAIIIGPLLGLIVCNIIGSTNGFMEFIQRTALPVRINFNSYVYALVAAVFFIATTLIPILSATKKTIIQYKQSNGRKESRSLWQKYYLDILLLIISLYGLYTYKTRLSILKLTSSQGYELPIDPLLFCISTIFILSCAMIFLRIFPYIIKIVFLFGKQKWSPVFYSSLMSVLRAKGQHKFIMIFLILTIATGIFNANTARTINQNAEEKERYKLGADVTIQAKWENEAIADSSDTQDDPTAVLKKEVIFSEPSFDEYKNLEGVDIATKVLKQNNGIAYYKDRSYSNIYIMGIIPNEFAKTAWFRTDLLPYHYINYLNLLSKDPRAVLVSTTFKDKYDAKLGDVISLRWGKNEYFQAIIYGFVDYWPSYNPYENTKNNQTRDFVVGNLNYFQMMTKMEPYEVWIKLKNDTTIENLYKNIKEKDLKILSIDNIREHIINIKNDAMLQGTNGALTLGFIVTMLITMIGFLIYWIVSIKSRTLQFGIYRALGLNVKEIIKMLLFEQILLSGTSVIIGILVGGITSDLFTPLLQIAYKSSEQVPPFKITAYGSDYLKIYLIIVFIFITSFIVLGRLIKQIKINQAIKLGED